MILNFAAWADDLSEGCVRLEARKIVDEPFRATLSRVKVNSLRISRVAATRHEIRRLRSHIASGTEDLCVVKLQLTGSSSYMQRDHLQVCAPGDLAVADTTEPFVIEYLRDVRAVCFAVPRELLPHRFLERPRLMLSNTQAGRALSRTLASYSELCLSLQSPETDACFSEHIVELIGQADKIATGDAPERISTRVMLSMMLDCIDRDSHDPDLSALTLAQKFRCSARYVHKLFEATGLSVGEHVNSKRMSVCIRELVDNRANRTIAEIAFAAGFNDISSFNRLFKRLNGMSPRDFRRLMIAQAKKEM